MPHTIYKTPADLPALIPVFPLTGVVLLPRGQLPLNIFEPRYLAMVNSAISSDRIIGMIQPKTPGDAKHLDDPEKTPALQNIGCTGRITSFAEAGDKRILMTLTGVCRFQTAREVTNFHPYRVVEADYTGFLADFKLGAGEGAVDRNALMKCFKDYASLRKLNVDWKAMDEASNEALVNGLSMASPFGLAEKQALLEAVDLQSRAEMLIALTEMTIAQGPDAADTTLQ